MPDALFIRRVSAAVVSPYREGVAANARRFRLPGSAYKALHENFPEQGGSFWIESARHLAGPLRALADPQVRKVFIVGATQCIKSVVGDIWTPYVMEHCPGNMLVLFETDPKAQAFCDTRLMEVIRAHPILSERLAEVTRRNRFDVTTTKIKMSGMTLDAGGLNDSNVSTFSYQYVWVSESWQAKSNGLLRKAIKRADRFPDSCKILIESQAGLADEDLHTEAKNAHPVPLTWACPFCGGRQQWDFTRLRGEDFTGTAKPGTYSGMAFDPEEETLKDGTTISRTIDERARSAKWECYHCGEKIPDTWDIRRKIMDSYDQDYQITLPNGERISPKEVCFFVPFESALGNSFENSAKSYLKAKDAERNGNMEDLKTWHMAERAEFWEPKMLQRQIVTTVGSYDPKAIVENEHHRGLVIDCQKHIELDTVGSFWFETYFADKSGNSWQLERGFVTSWDELRSIQKKWKIPNHYVCIDGRKWTPAILQKVAEYRELQNGSWAGRQMTFWSTWKVLLGDDARHFPWVDKQYRVWSPPTMRPESIINSKGEREIVRVMMYRWSNPSIKDQLNDLRIGGEGKPKFLSLSRSQVLPKTQAKEAGDLAYDKQMSAEVRGEKNGKVIWEKIRPNNHYWDLACMRLVRMAMENLCGHIAAPE